MQIKRMMTLQTILAIGDIHWGAIDAKMMYYHLYQVLYTIEQMKNEIDLIVICGDYFDYRLSLNSKSASLAIQWMHQLKDISKTNGVKAIRVIKGTEDHDNNQLNVFDDMIDEYFKIYRVNTVEDINGIRCLFCPDENINWKDYEQKYLDNLMSQPDIAFLHGSFDIVLPDIVVQESEETSAKSVIYPYGVLSGLVKGPLISAHWHDPFDQEPLHYIGSFESWAHGEQNIKGFAIIRYNEDNYTYHYHRILNVLAREFCTIVNDTRLFHDAEDYSRLIEDVKKIQKEKPGIMIRLLFTISDDNPKNGEYLTALKYAFINDRTVKIVIKDLLKKAEKEKRKQKTSSDRKKYSFIRDRNIRIPEKIQEYILIKKGKEIPIDMIRPYIQKYLPDEV